MPGPRSLLANLLDEDIQVAFPIFKVEENDNGDMFVYGKATDDSLDSDQQIIDADFAAKGLEDWLSSGANVRVMHSTNLYPAGVGVELHNDEGGQYLKSEVVEPTAKLLVRKGVLRAYSVGISRPKIVHDNKARGGRVVDGIFSEVSLVDRPANSNCKLSIIKRAKDNGVEVLNALEGDEAEQMADILKAQEEAELTKDAPAECPNCHAPVPDDQKGGTKCQKCGGMLAKAEMATADVNDLPDSDFAYIEPGGEKDSEGKTTPREKRHFPIHDADHVRNALARASQSPFGDQAMPKIRAAAEKFGIEVSDGGKIEDEAELEKGKVPPQFAANDAKDGDDGGKCPTCKGSGKIMGGNRTCPDCGGSGKASDAKGKVARVETFAVKRLHDMLCAVYPWEAIEAEYPTVQKNGVATTLGPITQGLIYQMLANEVTEDGGSGSESEDIAQIGKAYKCLVDFLSDEAGEAAMSQPSLMAEARASLHKAFLDLNKGILPGFTDDGSTPDGMPHPSDPPHPGSFKRPYISAGHYQEEAHSTSVPMPKASHVPHPEDFQRDTLTDGHEADSPGNKAEGEPEVTKEGPERPTKPRQSARTYYSNAAKDAATAVMAELHDHISSLFPQLCNMGGEPQPLTDSSGKVIPMQEDGPVTHSHSTSDTAGSTSDGGAIAAGAGEPEIKKTEVAELVKAAVAEVEAKYDGELQKLSDRIDEYESQPDPAVAPWRGTTVANRATDEHDAASEEALRKSKAEEDDIAAQREYLEGLVNSGNPEIRLRAQARLDKLLTPALTK